ncbi:hypothetical protein [Erythrobacter sp. EC-HK427]|uniref:hypothetical protein n=1 Tax=Erythrobacter sp. EC-HK427 TaxID=2038396 RepID=UPI0012546FD3|nr:hypothetical protein [Erythrobacter sp. EC-HK427]VVT04999.1 conserved hypothetical protein [Erythrobacter sp. EC-HK427]
MSVYDSNFDWVIDTALRVLFDKGADIFTFALYYDHESYGVCAYADTRGNSLATARQFNAFQAARFHEALAAKDLEKASSWAKVPERSYSIGDFTHKHLGWVDIKAPNNSAPFYLAMLNALLRNADRIAALSRDPDSLVFCSNGKRDEVEFTWRYRAG